MKEILTTNNLIIFAFLVFISTLFFWFSIILKYLKKKKLSENDKKEFKKIFKNLNLKSSDKERIIDYDKLYHKILQRFWYNWTFWEILKQKPNEIWDLNKVWELHKLRNKLVHDFDEKLEKNLKNQVFLYEKEIEKILK